MNDWCWISTPRMLTNSPSTICPRSQGMHTLLVSTVTHTHTHTHTSTHTLTSDQSVHDLPLWILTGRPNRPAFRRSGIPGSTLPYSPPSAPPTHGPVSEWSAPRHFTRGVLALGQSEGFVRPFWGFWMRLVIRWLTDYGELTHSVWSTHGINHI